MALLMLMSNVLGLEEEWTSVRETAKKSHTLPDLFANLNLFNKSREKG